MTPYDVRDAPRSARPGRLVGRSRRGLPQLLQANPFRRNLHLAPMKKRLAPCSLHPLHGRNTRLHTPRPRRHSSYRGIAGCVCKSIQIYAETTECAFCVECAPDSSVTRLELSWLSQPSYSGAHPRDSKGVGQREAPATGEKSSEVAKARSGRLVDRKSRQVCAVRVLRGFSCARAPAASPSSIHPVRRCMPCPSSR